MQFWVIIRRKIKRKTSQASSIGVFASRKNRVVRVVFISDEWFIDSKSGQPADKARFNFGADGDEDPAVDLFAQAEAAEEEESAVPKGETAAEGDEEEEEPEDDFNAAWEILDLARTTYESMPGDESKLKLAATYMALGDISLETGRK